ncbi:MAG TPA: peptidylprolyl isomerase [Cyclobacteriaceae bacterium]|nr:peptidylprolyl isomerase [Cyclobacteriaceae bacterium]
MLRYFIFSLFVGLSVQIYSQKPSKKDFVVTIKTSYGDMVMILYNETPKHKANFIKLAKQHYFDSLMFHRVIAGFMIQGGDPDSKKAKPGENLGMGGPGYTVEAEFNPKLFHKKGALAAARTGGPSNPTKASSGSQFYIVQGTVLGSSAAEELRIDQSKLNQGLQQFVVKPEHQAMRDTLGKIYTSGNMDAFKKKVFALAPEIEKETGIKIMKDVSPEKVKTYSTLGGVPFLDGDYTVFGEVIRGLDVLDKIAMVKKDGTDRPLEDVRMFVSVEELSKKKITKRYGFLYPEARK